MRHRGDRSGVSLARLVHVAGVGGVPGTGPVIQAVIANLTAVTPTVGTYLVAYPASLTKAPLASDLNLVARAILPNLVVVAWFARRRTPAGAVLAA